MPLTLEIVTPEARVYADSVDSVVIPTIKGEIGVLPGHIPLLTRVDHGALRITKGGTTQSIAVGGGFAQISGDQVSILAEQAVTADRIDEKAAEAAMERAQATLRESAHLDPEEFSHLQNLIRFTGTQLAVRRRRG